MTKAITAIKLHWFACTLTILVAITVLSLWPLDEFAGVPGTDKTHHLIAYALLMLPAALRKPHNWLAYGCFFIAYSGAIELIQPFFNRYAEWLDMFANTAGVFLGVIAAKLIDLVVADKQAGSK